MSVIHESDRRTCNTKHGTFGARERAAAVQGEQSIISRSGPPGSRMEMMLSLLYDIPVKVLSNTARALVTMEASPDAILKRNKW